MKLVRILTLALAFAGTSTMAFADTAPKKEDKAKSLYDRLGGKDAIVEDLVTALDKFKVPKKEKDELLGASAA